MNTTSKRIVGGVIAAVLLITAGVGGGYALASRGQDSTTTSANMSTVASRASTSSHNAADVMFAQTMLPHHEQALTMAKMADSRAASPQVKQLATAIEAAQQPEIDKMNGWLTAWGSSSMGMSMDHGMTGMMSGSDMSKLANMAGSEFDRMWLSMMTEHHNGAITMANDELKNGQNADALGLAAAIVVTQTAEVRQMGQLGGSS